MNYDMDPNDETKGALLAGAHARGTAKAPTPQKGKGSGGGELAHQSGVKVV